jgi:hypothetical protein
MFAEERVERFLGDGIVGSAVNSALRMADFEETGFEECHRRRAIETKRLREFMPFQAGRFGSEFRLHLA